MKLSTLGYGALALTLAVGACGKAEEAKAPTATPTTDQAVKQQPAAAGGEAAAGEAQEAPKKAEAKQAEPTEVAAAKAGDPVGGAQAAAAVKAEEPKAEEPKAAAADAGAAPVAAGADAGAAPAAAAADAGAKAAADAGPAAAADVAKADTGPEPIKDHRGTQVLDPAPDSPEWVIKQALIAAMNPDEPAAWEAFEALLHSKEKITVNAIRSRRQFNWPAMRRKVKLYFEDDTKPVFFVQRIEVIEADQRLKIFVHNERSMPTPCYVVRETEEGDLKGKWRIGTCSL